MLSKNSQITIVSKVVIMLTNFATVILSSHLWGTEGRGEISLVMADISIIAIFSSMLGGSTIAFHSSKIKQEFLFGSSFLGALIFPIVGTVFFTLVHGNEYFFQMLLISIFMSISNTFSLFFLGKKNIIWYNIILLGASTLILLLISISYFILDLKDLSTFFNSYFLAYSIITIIGLFKFKSYGSSKIKYDFGISKKIFKYGFHNELSYLIQFLNYRLAYYFIAFLLGKSTLGVFSIAVAISEAVLIISKSLSAIHFSDIINSDNKKEQIILTNKAAKNSFIFSLIIVIAIGLTPEFVFRFVFGDGFEGVKNISLSIMPGVIALSISNLYGHYFAGIGRLDILRNKSLIGLVATVALLFALVPTYKLNGVIITFNVSYILSSLFLFMKFKKEETSA